MLTPPFDRQTGAVGEFSSVSFLVDFLLSEFLPQLTDSTVPRDVTSHAAFTAPRTTSPQKNKRTEKRDESVAKFLLDGGHLCV